MKLSLAAMSFHMTVSGQLSSAPYDIAKQRLMVLSCANFINNVTQGEIEADSSQLMACHDYGLGRLFPYMEGYPDTAVTRGEQFIDAGKVVAAKKWGATLKGTDRIRLFLDLGNYYLFLPGTEKSDLDSALNYFAEAKRLSTTSASEKWLNETVSALGKLYFQAGDLTKSKFYFTQLIDASESRKDLKCLALAYENAGKYLPSGDSNSLPYLKKSLILYRQIGLKEKQIEVLTLIVAAHMRTDWNAASEELQQILDLQKSIGYRHSHFVYYVMAYIESQRGNHGLALELCQKSLGSMQLTGDTLFYPVLCTRVGSTYLLINKYDDAISWFKKGLDGYRSRETQPFWYSNFLSLIHAQLELNKPREALKVIQEIDRNYQPVTMLDKIFLAGSKGLCYEQLGQKEMAGKNFSEFVTMAARFPVEYMDVMFASFYCLVASFEIDQHDGEKAGFYIEKAKQIPAGRQSTIILRDLANLQFRLDSATGNYKLAIDDHIRYKRLDDTLKSINQIKQMNELIVKNQTELKDQNIKLLTQKDRLQEADLKQASLVRNVIIAGACLLFIILALVFYQNITKQKVNKIITRQNHSMQELLRDKELLLEDKEVLMKEIHHRVKNNLQMISSLLESQSAYLADEALLAIQKSQHRVQAISLIHQKLYMSDKVTQVLMSVYLKEIVSYLRDSFVSNESIVFHLDLDPIELDVTQAVPIGLIVNEGITNAIKYAFHGKRTGHIEISMKENESGICYLQIKDDGKGLSPDFDVNKNNSLGMSLIRGLSKNLQATFTILSENGTTIEIVFVNMIHNLNKNALIDA